MADFYAYDKGLPCRNPNCKSHGAPHPNCKCYSGAMHGMAKGGCVSMEPHKPDCIYFMQGGQAPALYADGGQVQPLPQYVDNPGETVGAAALHHGLLGLLKNVGHAKMNDPEKHAKILEQAQDQHHLRSSNFAEHIEAPKKTVGVRLGNHLADGNYGDAAEMLSGHPLVGGTPKSHLKPIMERLAHPLLTQEPDPEAFRSASEYLSSAIKGKEQLEHHLGSFLGKQKKEKDIEADEKERSS